MEYIVVFRNATPSSRRLWLTMDSSLTTDKAKAQAVADRMNADAVGRWEYRVATIEV